MSYKSQSGPSGRRCPPWCLARHLLLWSHMQFKSTSRGSSIVRPTHSHDSSRPPENGPTNTVQAQEGQGAGPAGRAALAHPDLVSQTNFPHDSPSLAHSSDEGPPLSGAQHHMAPASRSVEPPCVAPGLLAAHHDTVPGKA